jgi:hypothetical protein
VKKAEPSLVGGTDVEMSVILATVCSATIVIALVSYIMLRKKLNSRNAGVEDDKKEMDETYDDLFKEKTIRQDLSPEHSEATSDEPRVSIGPRESQLPQE